MRRKYAVLGGFGFILACLKTRCDIGVIITMVKRYVAAIMPIILCLAFFSAVVFRGAAPVSNITSPLSTVILDAGHGGFDGGAVAPDGTVEKDINLKIALTAEKLLHFNGFEVIMTRTEDTATEDDSSAVTAVRKRSDLKNRLALMKKYPNSVYVSIHLNKFTTSAASGSQVFYAKGQERSELLGDCIQKSVVSMLQPENKRTVKPGTSKVFLLDNAVVPAVIVECGFLSNHRELELLKNEDYQTKLAFAVTAGITDYFSEE